MAENVYLEATEVRKSEELDSCVAYYRSSADDTNPYYNCNSVDGNTGQHTVNEDFCQLSLEPWQPLAGQTEEPTKSKGPKKWNNKLRHHLGKNGRKKAQADDSRKSIVEVISGSFQKLFGRPSSYNEKGKNPRISNGFDSNSTSDLQIQGDQQLSLANANEEEEDSNEMMWSDNEFDEDLNVYANVNDTGEAEDKDRKEMEGEEARRSQLAQVPNHSTQIATQLTQAVTDESPAKGDAASTQITTCSTHLPNDDVLVEDIQPDYELIDFGKDNILYETTVNKKQSKNGDYNVDNFDHKSEDVMLPDSNENPTIASDSNYTDNTTQSDQTPRHASDNSSSVKFNVLLRNFNKTKDDNGAGIVNCEVTEAEFDRKDFKSVLRSNEKSTDCSQTNKWVKQEPTADRQSSCCLYSETTRHKWIPANPADVCASKQGTVNVPKPSVTCPIKPNAISATKLDVTGVKKPGVACAPKPTVTCVTEPSVVNVTKSGAGCVIKLSVTCATTKPNVTWVKAKPSFACVTTTPSVTFATKHCVVDCVEEPVAVSAKERAVMSASSFDAKKINFQEKDSKEIEQTANQAADTAHTLGQSTLDTNQTQSPNILKMIKLFESSKTPEKLSNQARSNKNTPGLSDSDSKCDKTTKATRPAVPKKLKPMSGPRSLSSAKGTSTPPPLPARICHGSSRGPAGGTVPVQGGRALRDGVPDVLPATTSHRRPPGPRFQPFGNFYLARADSASPAEEGTKMEDDDDDVTVEYVDDSELGLSSTSASVRAVTQPLPPVPNGSSNHPPKPKRSAHSKGSHRAVALPNDEDERDETTTSGDSQRSAWRSRSLAQGREAPAVPAVPIPKPAVPGRSTSAANLVTATGIRPNSSELEEARKNLGKRPGRISSERDEPSTIASHSMPSLTAAIISARDKDKKPKPPPGLPSKKNTTIATDQLIPTLEQQPWYRGELSRKDCDALIASEGQNGAFIVRRRCDDADGFPYALSILHENRSHNIRIRRRPDNTFALGTEKPGENIFNDIMEMVNFHRNNPIKLNNSVKVKLISSAFQR